MLNKSKEWFVEAKWGRIACVSWGDPKNSPVLMVHGYMDTAATFIPILKYLPDNFYYVAVDLPGHGRSDPFPVSALICQAHQVYALRQVIEHLKWDRFVYIAHSIGFIVGVLYNNVYPFEIVKMINFDPVQTLSTYCSHDYYPDLWYLYLYDDYYSNYTRWEQERTKQLTYDQAVNLLMRSRKLTREQSAILLTRILVPVGEDRYRLSWEPSMKKIAGIPMTEKMLISIVTTNPPPMLNTISIRNDTIPEKYREKGVELMKLFQERLPDFKVINVDGHHDVHITNPELFVDKVIDYLNSDVKNVLAKL